MWEMVFDIQTSPVARTRIDPTWGIHHPPPRTVLPSASAPASAVAYTVAPITSHPSRASKAKNAKRGTARKRLLRPTLSAARPGPAAPAAALMVPGLERAFGGDPDGGGHVK